MSDKEELFIVRFYDGFDGRWMDITKPLPMSEAQKVYDLYTENGTKNTNFDNIDYYRIFPADTIMILRY